MTRNLLTDGEVNKTVFLTEQSKKLTIDGRTAPYQIYKVRLDQLYFNDKNDRIATWISQYKAENNVRELDTSNEERYNKIIHKFIVESNPGALDKTQTNIELVGQREPGVVLVDGRIIDGNRRFTCLRNISEKKGEPQFFETVILDYDITSNEKQIKYLELSIQHGVDKPVDYNPIDRLVGIYNDIIDRKLFTEKEYARGVNQPESDVKKDVEKAKLMVEFLEFINAPKQFHIAREMKLDGPLQELVAILRKAKTLEAKNNIKNAVFTNFFMQPEGDMTRYIRKVKKVVESEHLDDFLEKQLELSEKVLEILPEKEEMSIKKVNEVRANIDIKEDLINSLDDAVDKANSTAARNEPVKLITKAEEMLEMIDMRMFKKMNDKNLKEMCTKVRSLEALIGQIKGELSAD